MKNFASYHLFKKTLVALSLVSCLAQTVMALPTTTKPFISYTDSGAG